MNSLSTKFLAALGVLAAVLFAYGIIQLFLFRAGVGDSLPPYSSYRADPVGVKAFYEGLASLPGMEVRRNRDKLAKLATQPGETLLFVGTPYYGDIDEVEEEIVEALEAAANAGARVVLAFIPDPEGGFRGASSLEKEEENKPEEKKEDKPAEKKEEDPFMAPPPTVSLRERWGLTCAFARLEQDDKGEYAPATATLAQNYTGADLPESLSWHAALYFTELAGEWRPVYVRGEWPVLIERPFGAGTLVLSSDSYFMSNEALRIEPQPALLAWVVGPARVVLFDEYLHGIQANPGIMALARRYRLHGLGLGLLVLGVLYIWRAMSPLVPRRTDPAPEEAVPLEGRDAAAALQNLLRRHVPRHELLGTCLHEWRSAQPRISAEEERRFQEAEAIAAAEEAKPAKSRNRAEAYKAISALLGKQAGRVIR